MNFFENRVKLKYIRKKYEKYDHEFFWPWSESFQFKIFAQKALFDFLLTTTPQAMNKF